MKKTSVLFFVFAMILFVSGCFEKPEGLFLGDYEDTFVTIDFRENGTLSYTACNQLFFNLMKSQGFPTSFIKDNPKVCQSSSGSWSIESGKVASALPSGDKLHFSWSGKDLIDEDTDVRLIRQ